MARNLGQCVIIDLFQLFVKLMKRGKECRTKMRFELINNY